MKGSPSYNKLIKGFEVFQKEYMSDQFKEYRSWTAKQQQPKVMMIACSDSRVNPSILTHAALGEIFMVNNVANIVPPYELQHDTHHSTSAAIEFAVQHLKVDTIIVMGHSNCGGIKALMEISEDDPSFHDKESQNYYSFILPWMKIVENAKKYTKSQQNSKSSEEDLLRLCEQKSITLSLTNLMTFPFVEEAVLTNKLKIHGWYFEIQSGSLYVYNQKHSRFELI